MLRFSKIALLAFLYPVHLLLAQPEYDPRGTPTLNYWSRYAAVSLEADRIRYTPGADIRIHAIVNNRGYQVIRIYPHALPNKTFQLFVTDRQGREIPQKFNAESYEQRERGAPVIDQQGRQVKEIILAPNESFSKVLHLNDFYDLPADNEYRVYLYFYPNPQYDMFVRSENTIHLRIAPPAASVPPELQHDIDKQRKLALSPSETVYLFLSAEIQRNWPNYLKYLDLPKFITCYRNYAARYAQAHQRAKPAVLRAFSNFLISEPVDPLRRFRILAATPERDATGSPAADGRYFVRAWGLRQKADYQARYEYRYTLEAQRDGFWKITHVEAKLIR